MADVEVVGVAADGAEAVELACSLKPDVVLLDVHMPRLGGFDAAETIRAPLPGTLVLLHAGEISPSSVEQGRAMGVHLLDKLRLPETLLSIVMPR